MSESERNSFEWEQHPVDDNVTLELCQGLREDRAASTGDAPTVIAASSIIQSLTPNSYKHSCVIDAQGFYKTLVLVTSQTGRFDDTVIYSYQLQPGERLIDAKSPGGTFCKPKWDGEQWTEGATTEEVAAWEAAKPVPEPAPPSQVEQLAVEMTMAMAEMQLQHDMAIAELTVAMAGGTEVNADV